VHRQGGLAVGRGTVSTLRSAHTIWLMRRATLLRGISGEALDDAPDPRRAELFHCVADKVSKAIEDATPVSLTPQQLMALTMEADQLTQRATNEIRRADQRNLERGEEWIRTARAFREVVEAAVLIEEL
jgi:hypothetical protein